MENFNRIAFVLLFISVFTLCGCGHHLEKGKCHIWPGGSKLCGPLDECFTGSNGVKVVDPIRYKGHMVNGAPKGEGAVCIGTKKDSCFMECDNWIMFGKTENNCPKIVGYFDSGKVTGYYIFPNTPKEKIVDKSLPELGYTFWGEEFSSYSKCKKYLE